jgi:hypothetical protein
MTKINVGDTVRHIGSQSGQTYEVWGRGPDGVYLWISYTDSTHPPFTGRTKLYEKVEPFFKVGHVYEQTNLNGHRQQFEVLAVGGLTGEVSDRAAFGVLTTFFPEKPWTRYATRRVFSNWTHISSP